MFIQQFYQIKMNEQIKFLIHPGIQLVIMVNVVV